MKCSEAQKQILLQDSGELDATLEKALVAHLHDCEECVGFQYALAKSKAAFHAEEEPSATVLNHIKREARRRAPQPKQTKILYWKPALAMAASILIGLGLFLSVFRPDTVGLELVMTEIELFDIQDQAISVMYDGLSEDDLAFNFLMTYEEES